MQASESRKPRIPPRGPAAAISEVSRATAPIAMPAQTGWLPVANAITVRTKPEAAAISARRLEIPEGPPEPAAATMMPPRGPL
jgi:hypothetical protein